MGAPLEVDVATRAENGAETVRVRWSMLRGARAHGRVGRACLGGRRAAKHERRAPRQGDSERRAFRGFVEIQFFARNAGFPLSLHVDPNPVCRSFWW